MICYRDMTFCSFYKSCAKANKCGRKLDEQVKVGAKKIGLPIAQFVNQPECFKRQND